MKCLLCFSPSFLFVSDAYKCPVCHLLFKDPQVYLTEEEAEARYLCHQNGIQHSGYVDFLNRLIKPLLTFVPNNFTALDFGCGPSPTLSIMLNQKNGTTFNYDPLFLNNEDLLKETYDVVTATEVVEHFKFLAKDWELLFNLTKTNGILAIMTQFFNSQIDYQKWWYKNDPTHLAFYSLETFNYIAKYFQMKIIYNDNNSVVIFKK